MSKIVSQLNKEGVFLSAVEADESPLEKGVFLIPAGAVDATPPSVPEKCFAKWNGSAFDIFPIPVPEPAPEPEPATKEEILATFTSEIQKRLDSFARTRSYDGILSACTYATSLIPKFKAEGLYAVEARDNTWAAAYGLLAEVEAGTRPMPTLDEVIAALPELMWPQ